MGGAASTLASASERHHAQAERYISNDIEPESYDSYTMYDTDSETEDVDAETEMLVAEPKFVTKKNRHIRRWTKKEIQSGMVTTKSRQPYPILPARDCRSCRKSANIDFSASTPGARRVMKRCQLKSPARRPPHKGFTVEKLAKTPGVVVVDHMWCVEEAATTVIQTK